MIYCNQCGRHLSPEMQMCASCGCPITSALEDPSAQSPMTAGSTPDAMSSARAQDDQLTAFSSPRDRNEGEAMTRSTLPAAPGARAKQEVRLWNPMVALYWSILFFPVFGALLHRLNWQVLGHPRRATLSIRWGLALTAAELVVPVFLPTPENDLLETLLYFAPTLVFLTFWYFVDVKDQVALVAQLPNGYVKKRWAMPLWIASAATFVILLFSILALYLEVMSGSI